MAKDFNFYTDVPLDVRLGKKIFNCQLGVFCLIAWDKKFIPTFDLVNYQINEIKLNGKIVSPEKKMVDAIKLFWQNNEKALNRAVLKEYMTFAYICEGQKNKNTINLQEIIEKI